MEVQWKCSRDVDSFGLRKGKLEAMVDGRMIYSRKFFIVSPGRWSAKVGKMKDELLPKIAVLVEHSS